MVLPKMSHLNCNEIFVNEMQGVLYSDLSYLSILFTQGKHYNKSSNKYIHIFLYQFHAVSCQRSYKFVCTLHSNFTFRIYPNELFKNIYKDLT